MQCVLATSNLHKRDEIGAILVEIGARRLELSTLRDFPQIKPPVEDGETFAENARIKALAVSTVTGGWAMADDSGLVVDALGGAPGIHSARYGGDNATDADRIAKLLRELEGVPAEKRTARFVCAMALCRGGEVVAETEGVCEGGIAEAPSGDGGFGYDPVFYLPERGRTVAEIGAEEKNRVSHRARAVRQLKDALAAL